MFELIQEIQKGGQLVDKKLGFLQLNEKKWLRDIWHPLNYLEPNLLRISEDFWQWGLINSDPDP